MKGKKTDTGKVIVLTAAGVAAYFVFGGTARADPNQGAIGIDNILDSNSSVDQVTVGRSPGTVEGVGPEDKVSNTTPLGHHNVTSDLFGQNYMVNWKPVDSNSTFLLNFLYNGTIPTGKQNKLKFNYPFGGDWEFGTKPIIFESDRIPYGPVVDVRRAINQNSGDLPLIDLVLPTNLYPLPYGTGDLDIGTRLVANLDDKGIVDFIDFAIFANDWRNHLKASPEVSCVANISGPNGIPDGYNGKAVVDELYMGVLAENWLVEL